MSISTKPLGSNPTSNSSRSTPKLPQPVFDTEPTAYAFSPNRETLGGTAYLIPHTPAQSGDSLTRNNILVDCPGWTETNLNFIEHQGGIGFLVITHRGGASRVGDWQAKFNCQVIVQEQEAYLLPQVKTQTFHRTLDLTPHHRLLWTPGHSPGSLCLYSASNGGTLFTGRHLLPTREGGAAPLRVAKTFHWPRQLKNVQRLLEEFTPQTLANLCPGANTGFLRGKKSIHEAYQRLSTLDFQTLATAQALM
ncbi:MAG: MBL fold metallo-hydrolase [Cyanobacteria bacterium J06642_11]